MRDSGGKAGAEFYGYQKKFGSTALFADSWPLALIPRDKEVA